MRESGLKPFWSHFIDTLRARDAFYRRTQSLQNHQVVRCHNVSTFGSAFHVHRPNYCFPSETVIDRLLDRCFISAPVAKSDCIALAIANLSRGKSKTTRLDAFAQRHCIVCPCPKYFVPHALLSITNLSFADSSQLPELSDVRYLAHRALDDFHIRFGRSEIKLPPAGFGVFVNYVQATNTEGVEIMGLFKLDNQDDNVYYPVHLNCGSAGPFEGLDRFIVMLKVQYAMGFATHSFIVKAEIEDSRNA